jgi:hypothetical protein
MKTPKGPSATGSRRNVESSVLGIFVAGKGLFGPFVGAGAMLAVKKIKEPTNKKTRSFFQAMTLSSLKCEIFQSIQGLFEPKAPSASTGLSP